jgi:tetratricopeptide (TPR) repeat protein
VTRLEARAARGLSPFVGRADALATLERAFAATHAGRGQAVFVVGEAGMGKSRLLLEFHRRVADQALWAEGECVSFGQSTPYFAVINLLKRTFGVGDRDGEAAIVEKIQRGLAAACPDAPEIAPYLRYLLAVDPGDPTLAGMDPAQRQQGIVAAVQRCAAEASRRRPLVLVIEDLHWIDGASEDYLKRFVESLPGMAVLLILTWRPVYPQPFGDRTYYWRIGLQSLDDEDAFRIVSAALATEELPRELAAVVARKAEGNPFFLEELGRTLAETGAVRVEAGRVLVAQPAAALAVPDTVQDVIAARLDRLEEAQKRTVQTASVIGREFALALLRRVSDVQDQLDRSLAELRHVELIYEKAGFGSAEYVFRHALTQDVAYASLLVAERRRLHGLIGAAIEDVYAGRLEERAEELVYHFTRGEVWDKVARYARDAAERAAGLFVDARAVEFYELALEALHRLPETRETARAGIEIRLGMRPPLWRAGKLEPLFERMTEAEALATRHGESEPLDTIFSFLVQYHWAKGDQERALEYGRRCLEIADAKDDLGLRVTAHFYMCHSDEALGRFTEGLHHAQAIVDLLEGPRERERFGLSGLPYCGACAMAAWSVSELGDPEGGLDFIRRGRRVADAANHLYSQAVLATCEGYVLVDHRTPGEAIAVLEPAVKICREKGFVGWLMLAVAALARAYARAGRAEDAIRLAKEGVALQEGTGATVNRAYLHLNVAWACLAAGRLDEAEAAVATALEFAGRQGERAWQAWGAFILGETARARGDRAAAAQRYDEAQELAEELAMRPLVERCRAALRTLG